MAFDSDLRAMVLEENRGCVGSELCEGAGFIERSTERGHS